MEPARAAVAALDGVKEATLATQLPFERALFATAAPTFDWAKAGAQLQPQQYWITAYRADDLASNVIAATAAERTVAAEVRAVRQRAWTTLARADGWLLADRMIWHELASLCRQRPQLWDPRLDELATMSDAVTGFWREAAPALATEVPALPVVLPSAAPAVAALPARVNQSRQIQRGPVAMQAHAEASAVIGDRTRHAVAMRLCWDRIAAVCAEVAAHAESAAGRTQLPSRAEQYRALAGRCRDLAMASNDLLGR